MKLTYKERIVITALCIAFAFILASYFTLLAVLLILIILFILLNRSL